MVICILLFSSVMYLVEDQGSSEAADCPMGVCQFRSIPSTFWWAIVTMTTVGYGDAVPVTVAGKVVAGATMICGIIVIALPISVLGNNFTKLMQQFADESLIITQADLDGSGFVDAAEVARWLDAMRKVRSERQRTPANASVRSHQRCRARLVAPPSHPPHLPPSAHPTLRTSHPPRPMPHLAALCPALPCRRRARFGTSG